MRTIIQKEPANKNNEGLLMFFPDKWNHPEWSKQKKEKQKQYGSMNNTMKKR